MHPSLIRCLTCGNRLPVRGESASGSPCHYLRCGSDRAVACQPSCRPCNGRSGGDPSQTLPLDRLSRGGPAGDLQPPAPLPLRL